MRPSRRGIRAASCPSANGLSRVGKQSDFLRMAEYLPCHDHASSHGDPPMAILSIGSRGPEVVTLQQELNRQLFPSPRLSTDGVFGRLTRNAVRAAGWAFWNS